LTIQNTVAAIRAYGGTYIKMKKSVFVKELEEFAVRLKEDGYCSEIVELAAERQHQLEQEILRLHSEIDIDKIVERSNN